MGIFHQGDDECFNKCLDILNQSSIKCGHKARCQLIKDFDNDPLTIKLLASYLTRFHQGQLSGLEFIPVLYDNEGKDRSLRRLLSAFETKFIGQAELPLLYLLSMSDTLVCQQEMETVFQTTFMHRLLNCRDDYQVFLKPLNKLNSRRWNKVVITLNALNLLEQSPSKNGKLLSLTEPVKHYFQQKLQMQKLRVQQGAYEDMQTVAGQTKNTSAQSNHHNHSALEISTKPESVSFNVETKFPIPEPIPFVSLWSKTEEIQATQKQLKALRSSLEALKNQTQEINGLLKGPKQHAVVVSMDDGRRSAAAV